MSIEKLGLLEIMKQFAVSEPEVEALWATHGNDYLHDPRFYTIKAVFYTNQGCRSNVSKKFFDYLKTNVGAEFFKQGRSWNVMLPDYQAARVSFNTIDKIDMDLLFESSRYLTENIIVDKHGLLRAELQGYDFKDYAQKKFEKLLKSFLFYMREFRMEMSRNDLYRAYLKMFEVYKSLVGLTVMGYGRNCCFSEPNNLFYSLIRDYDLRNMLVSARPSLDFCTLLYKYVYIVIDIFWQVLGMIEDSYNFDIDYEFIKRQISGLDTVYYPMNNFRDIAKFVNDCTSGSKLCQGKVFRAGIYYCSGMDEYIIDFFNRNNIKTVIDLRDIREIGLMPKDEYDFVKYYTVMFNYVDFKYTYDFVGSKQVYKNLYYGLVKYNAEKIGEVLKFILEGLRRGSVVIHCVAGKDRTGLVIAILERLLGLDIECIVKDYMMSFLDTREENLRYVLSVIDDEFGGIERYVTEQCELSKEQVDELKRELLC